MLLGCGGIAVSAAGQLVALTTYLGRIPVDVAVRWTTMEALVGGLCFVILWISGVRRYGFRHPKGQRIRFLPESSNARLRVLTAALFGYWIITFVGLLVLGGITNKGTYQVDGNYYIRQPTGSRPIQVSRTEYQRQNAYVLWMFSASALVVSAGVVILATGIPVTTNRSNVLTELES
jgi:hypothetical protein